MHPGSVEGSFSLSETRLASWNRLSLLTQRLERQKGGDGEKLIAEIQEVLSFLKPIELYWAFPGKGALVELAAHLREREFSELRRGVGAIARALTSESYRYRPTAEILHGEGEEEEEKRGEEAKESPDRRHRPYFEVLIVDASSQREERLLREGLRHMRGADDAFLYDIVTVPSFEDALVACLFNFNIQAVLVRYAFDYRSANRSPAIKRFLAGLDDEDLELGDQEELSARLGQVLSDLRPELDLYLVADTSVEDVVSAETHAFRRVFYRQDDYTDLHLTILRGIGERYETPFFTALKRYAKQPTGVFHALPISRGTSVTRSHWIGDMVDFYGINIFLAETSATTGGLDSLLDPRGPIKRAQELAAKTFGAERTFFVTNGTSTANKIVVQAMLKPGDVVLVDRDCHKSHHYGFVLSGAQVSYLDSYPLREFTMYGAVPTAAILERLLAYKAEGRLDSVRMLLLTNCTFDGIVYNVEKVMEQALSIKPDLIFLWDEAWFAFAGFHPTYRQRTAMYVAEKLRRRYRSPAYRARYAAWAAQYKDEAARDAARAKGEGLPDPEKVRIRVYATQSTHKTLTAFRQASMIHVRDQDFQGRVATAFHEAYMTHTSTSPNYQLLASLDLGRRQMALEGFELVQKQVERAMILRERAKVMPTIARHLRFLSMRDLIPAEHRQSGIEVYYDPVRGWSAMEEAWAKDEFALDPTRLTLFTGLTGIDGARFRGEVLMDRYAIQINKTSRNSVLFMTHIGTTRSAIAYLLKSLNDFSQREDQAMEEASAIERERHQARVQALTQDAPELPHFSGFHPAFRGQGGLPDGDIRGAFFLGYEDANCSYLDIGHLSEGEIDKLDGDLVSAMFVIPYPPGFPLLVPGQIVSADVVRYLRKLDVKEIHGYRADLGLRVFKKEALPRG